MVRDDGGGGIGGMDFGDGGESEMGMGKGAMLRVNEMKALGALVGGEDEDEDMDMEGSIMGFGGLQGQGPGGGVRSRAGTARLDYPPSRSQSIRNGNSDDHRSQNNNDNIIRHRQQQHSTRKTSLRERRRLAQGHLSQSARKRQVVESHLKAIPLGSGLDDEPSNKGDEFDLAMEMGMEDVDGLGGFLGSDLAGFKLGNMKGLNLFGGYT